MPGLLDEIQECGWRHRSLSFRLPIEEVVFVDEVRQHLVKAPLAVVYLMLELMATLYTGHSSCLLIDW